MKILSYSLAALISFSAIGPSVHADPLLQYDTLEVGYRYTDPDPGTEYNGAYARGTYTILPHLFLDVGYAYDTSDDVDINTFQYGGGAFVALSRNVHLVANVGGKREKIELNEGGGGFIDYHEFGEGNVSRIYYGPELRAKFHPNAEFDLGFTRESGDGKTTNNYNLGLLFAVSNSAAIRVGAAFFDQDASQGVVGLRLSL